MYKIHILHFQKQRKIYFLTYNLHSLVNAQPFFSIVREVGEKGAVFDSSVNKQGDWSCYYAVWSWKNGLIWSVSVHSCVASDPAGPDPTIVPQSLHDDLHLRKLVAVVLLGRGLAGRLHVRLHEALSGRSCLQLL